VCHFDVEPLARIAMGGEGRKEKGEWPRVRETELEKGRRGNTDHVRPLLPA